MNSSCPFCNPPADRIVLATVHSVAIWDRYPVSPGHMLVLPRRHAPGLFDLTQQEREDLLDLLQRARDLLAAERSPDGYNIGINDGPAAGQTIMHLHIHLIPRYQGDTADPRGGVRWIFPDRPGYWSER